jgi:hypothetical protein
MPLNIGGNIINSEIVKRYPTTKTLRGGLLLHVDAYVPESYPGSGATFYDLSGNGNNFSITNATWNSAGFFSFNGSSTYMNNTSLSVPGLTNTASCIVWLKPDAGQNDGTYNGIFSYGPRSCTSQTFIMSMNNTNGPTMAKWCDDFTSPTASMNTSTWWQYTLVLNGSSVAFYLNGSASGTGTLAAANNITAGTAAIGSTDLYGRIFKGSIASVKFYNRVLSLTEITNNYNIEKSKFGL